MTEITKIIALPQYLHQSVTLAGWVVNLRSSGGVVFILMRDGSGVVQAVVSKDTVSEQIFALSQQLTQESSLKIKGIPQKDERSPGGIELAVTSIEPVQLVAEEYPIGNKEHGTDFLLQHRHLWLRARKQWAIQRVRHQLIMAIYQFLNDRGFTKIDAPIFTPTACEGTTTLFAVDYVNDKKVFLSQSGQLYLEAAIASFGQVFDFGPTFRAEKSKTRRHLTEFWMLDVEMAFANQADNMAFQEELVKFLVNAVLNKSANELVLLGRDLTHLKQTVVEPFAKITYAEAVSRLHDLGSKIEFGSDLGNEDETLLAHQFSTPVFVELFPSDLKAFYMKRNQDQLVLGSDLLAPEGYGEIIGGSEREDNYQTLLAQIRTANLSEADLSWYLDLRKYGTVPHSGFGLGLERLVAWVCGLEHVREAIPFPRTIYRTFP